MRRPSALGEFALFAWLGLALILIDPVAGMSAEQPPNVLLMVSDDRGYRDLGCFGSDEVKTPHLDRLAQHVFIQRLRGIMIGERAMSEDL